MVIRNAKLKDTLDGMLSDDYKERFKAEYYQTKIRYNKLRSFNAKIEAAIRCKEVNMPEHDCPAEVLLEQEFIMEEYLHILEVRAGIEGIEL